LIEVVAAGEDQSTMERSTVDIDPDMRLLCDEELDAVIGGVSGGGCFHFPAVLSLLTTEPAATAIVPTAI
jgi:hypothetical protein